MLASIIRQGWLIVKLDLKDVFLNIAWPKSHGIFLPSRLAHHTIFLSSIQTLHHTICILKDYKANTVYCFLFAVKKFHIFCGLLGNRETFLANFCDIVF